VHTAVPTTVVISALGDDVVEPAPEGSPLMRRIHLALDAPYEIQ
jgi:hypothetical protein